MSNEGQNASSGGTVSTVRKSPLRSAGGLAFSLVVIMLGILLVLVLALLIFSSINSGNSDLIEFSKWALSTLLGAFGAWIGAGAAYFFGKENLAESSASTEAALRIQQEAMQGVVKTDRIKEIALTAMNKEFMFNPSTPKKNVIDKLNLTQYKGYWWVPVLDQGGQGILEDIIHTRVFWDTTFLDGDLISKIVSDIDTIPNLKATFGALHGASFFVKVGLDDKIVDVISNMNKLGTVVGIVVDEKGKPTYCFTKQDLLNAQK